MILVDSDGEGGEARSFRAESITWEIYPASRASSARVYASSIRTGKQKTLASIAGPLETRLVTRDDGSIEVQVIPQPERRTRRRWTGSCGRRDHRHRRR